MQQLVRKAQLCRAG